MCLLDLHFKQFKEKSNGSFCMFAKDFQQVSVV